MSAAQSVSDAECSAPSTTHTSPSSLVSSSSNHKNVPDMNFAVNVASHVHHQNANMNHMGNFNDFSRDATVNQNITNQQTTVSPNHTTDSIRPTEDKPVNSQILDAHPSPTQRSQPQLTVETGAHQSQQTPEETQKQPTLTFEKQPVTPCRSSAPTSAFSSFSSKTYIKGSGSSTLNSPRISSEGSSPETGYNTPESGNPTSQTNANKDGADRNVHEFMLGMELPKSNFTHRYPPPRTNSATLGKSPAQARPHTTQNTPRQSPSSTSSVSSTNYPPFESSQPATNPKHLRQSLIRASKPSSDSVSTINSASTVRPSAVRRSLTSLDSSNTCSASSSATNRRQNYEHLPLQHHYMSSPNLALDGQAHRLQLTPPKQLHDLKTPLYIPAVLRKTEHHRTVSDSTPSVLRPPRRNHWRPDFERENCKDCDQRFSFFERRHHCRKCGEIFCANHVRFRVPLDHDLNFNPSAGDVKACTACAGAFQDHLVSLQVPLDRQQSSDSSASGTPSPCASSYSREVPRLQPTHKHNPNLHATQDILSASVMQQQQAVPASVANSIPADWSWSTF